MTTGQLLRRARKKAGLTQAELAEKLNISYQNISQWERDLRQPKVETLEKIAEALKISPADLGIIRYEAYFPFDPASHQILLDAIDRAFKPMPKLEPLNTKVSNSEALRHRLLQNFSALNEFGQQKAVERVEELTEIERYRKGKSSADGD